MSIIAWAPGLVFPKTSKGFFRYSRKSNEIGQRVFAFISILVIDLPTYLGASWHT